MEDGVNTAEVVRKLEGEGVSSWLANNFKGTKVFLGELPGWSGGSEELSFNKSLITNLEVWGRSMMTVGLYLNAFLGFGDGNLKFLVKLVEINNEFMSTGRGKITFRMYGDVGVVAFVSEERRDRKSTR